jgi:hypothetical protein
MDLKEIVWGGVDWIDPSPDKDKWQTPINKVNDIPGSIKCRKCLDYLRKYQVYNRNLLQIII